MAAATVASTKQRKVKHPKGFAQLPGKYNLLLVAIF
jgi:hypothetical protein